MTTSNKYKGYFSPSAAGRWLTCTASAELNAKAPRTDTVYSLEGTMAHELATLVLDSTFAEAPLSIDKEIAYGWSKEHRGIVTPEMADYVQDYVDYCNEIGESCDETAFEQRLNMSFTAQGQTGLVDWIGAGDDALHVIDFKYGQGVKVYAKDNEQGLMYAAAALEQYGTLYDFDKVVIHIHQPRIEHIDTWETTRAEVEQFIKRVKSTVLDIATGDVKFEPSEKACQFCAVKGTCVAYADKATLAARDVFRDVEKHSDWPPEGTDESEGKTMTPEERATALNSIALLKKWISAVEEAAMSDIEQGIDIPGWKIVEGRAQRKWLDEDAVLDLLKKKRSVKRDIYIKETLLSIAQLEKALKTKPKVLQEVQEYVTKGEGKHTLAPESDKRPSIGRPQDAFNEVADDPLES